MSAPVLTPGEAAYARRLAGDALYFALVETWRVLDAAGLDKIARGVELGQISWLIKAQDAREMSMRAIAKATGAA